MGPNWSGTTKVETEIEREGSENRASVEPIEEKPRRERIDGQRCSCRSILILADSSHDGLAVWRYVDGNRIVIRAIQGEVVFGLVIPTGHTE